jgi:hypothetical protein
MHASVQGSKRVFMIIENITRVSGLKRPFFRGRQENSFGKGDAIHGIAFPKPQTKSRFIYRKSAGRRQFSVEQLTFPGRVQKAHLPQPESLMNT